jgi:hypothetical protein
MTRYDTQYDADTERGQLNQRLDYTIENHARVTKVLCDELGEKIEAIERRHQFLVGLEQLQDDFKVPLKQLEKRLLLLQQINSLQQGAAYGAQNDNEPLARMTTEQLQKRIDCLQTINRLEPDPEKRISIKSLRERARLLSSIEHTEAAEGIDRGQSDAA